MARLFDRDSSQYLIANSAVVSAVPLTIAGWFNSSNVGVDYQNVATIRDSGSGHCFALHLDTNGYIRAYTSGDAGLDYAITTPNVTGDNEWHHACGVYAAADDRRAFLDGGDKGTQSDSNTPSNLDITTISKALDGGSAEHFEGMLAEIAIWNVALLDFEVWLMGKLKLSPQWVRPQNLVFYAPLVNNEDYDIVGHRKLTAVNSPTTAAHAPGIVYPKPRHRVIPGMPGTAPMLRAR